MNIIPKINLLTSLTTVKQCIRCYAVPGGLMKKMSKKGTGKIKMVYIDPEKDPNKLLSHCCGLNIYKTGEEIKLKEDSEYPSWLWNLRLGPPPSYRELEPDTLEYWRRYRKAQQIIQLKKMKHSKF